MSALSSHIFRTQSQRLGRVETVSQFETEKIRKIRKKIAEEIVVTGRLLAFL